MIIPTECIIVGGGRSIKQADSSQLQPVLASKFTILINYAFKHFLGTFLTFSDRAFYYPHPDYDNPNIYEELKQVPLIIGLNNNGVEEFKLPNTILLDYNKYRANLTGILALKLATIIMKKGTIYLLGFDWNRRVGLPERDPNYNPKSDLQIHYYDDIKHRGSGYVGYYENHNPNNDFLEYTKKRDIKIYNVSPESNINCFEKISYPEMFKLLTPTAVNQEELRKEIKNYL
jgi:hypothetical protein